MSNTDQPGASEVTAGKISSRRLHTGKVIELDVDTVRFPDGTVGEMDIVRHSGASAIVPFLRDPTGGDPKI
jgi:ADP-ribose pyrophosphatase